MSKTGVSALLLSLVCSPLYVYAADYQQALEDAIQEDFSALDVRDCTNLQGLFGLANGTRSHYLLGKLTYSDNQIFGQAREEVLAFTQVSAESCLSSLEQYLDNTASTKGGRAYLADLVPSVEMNSPGILSHTSHQLWLQRDEYTYTAAEGLTLQDSAGKDLTAAELSVQELARIASTDTTRPVVFPGPIAGWNNDAYLAYDENGSDIHIFFQHNPFADRWNHMHWGHLVIDNQGRFTNHPIALEPRPEEGYFHNFSGSVTSFKIPDPEGSGRKVTAAFMTATGTGENGFDSFLAVPPTVMAISSDENLDHWNTKRYTIHDGNVYKNKWDSINNEQIVNRYDMRDPILIERDGQHFLIVAGTAVPGRVGQGVIALLKPSNPDNWAEPWVYVGDMFRHPVAFEDGGPGILETPNLIQVGDKDILFFGAQRKASEGNLRGLNNNQGVQYFVGKFDPYTGKFTPDEYEGAKGYFEYGRSFYAINATQRENGGTFVGWILGHDARSDWNDRPRGWNGVTTFPRTISLVDGIPYTAPDERVANLRTNTLINKKAYKVSDTKLLPIKDRTFEVTATLDLSDADSMTMKVLADCRGNAGIPITFDGQTLSVGDEFIPLFKNRQTTVDVRILVDRSVIVVFANGKSLSKTVTPPKNTDSDKNAYNAYAAYNTYAHNVLLSTEGSHSYWRNLSVYHLGHY
jgi:beta-fructofuranosidase